MLYVRLANPVRNATCSKLRWFPCLQLIYTLLQSEIELSELSAFLQEKNSRCGSMSVSRRHFERCRYLVFPGVKLYCTVRYGTVR